MSRPRKYQTLAEKQAAYRARQSGSRPPKEAELARLARSLQVVLQEAVQSRTCPLPAELVGLRTDETLRNLIRYLDPCPDPVRYPRKEG
jgi:hypothetical protein